MAAGVGTRARRFPESRLADAVAPVAPGDSRQRRRRRDDYLGVAPGPERSGPGVGRAQTIQEVDRVPLGPEPPRQIEQPQGPGKKIVGREIIDPGVDEEERRTGLGQGKDLFTSSYMQVIRENSLGEGTRGQRPLPSPLPIPLPQPP